MPKLTIEQSHRLPPTEVRSRLDVLQAKLAEKYGIHGTWVSDTEAQIKRTGASGTIKCFAEKVVVQLDLSFALTPLKSKVENRVREELARCLSDAGPTVEPDAKTV